jgi:hypothetical protein
MDQTSHLTSQLITWFHVRVERKIIHAVYERQTETETKRRLLMNVLFAE